MPLQYSPYLKCTCQSESGMWWFLGEFCGEHAAVPEPAAGHCCTPVTPNFAENTKIKRAYICKEHALPEHSHSFCGNSHWPQINVSQTKSSICNKDIKPKQQANKMLTCDWHNTRIHFVLKFLSTCAPKTLHKPISHHVTALAVFRAWCFSCGILRAVLCTDSTL